MICLTDDEATALRDVLAMLAVIEERGLGQNHTIEISRELWRDMLLRPAQRLHRVGRLSLGSAVGSAVGTDETPNG